jgi:hypothetical protein
MADDSNSGKGRNAATPSVWDEAPDAPLVPFITSDQRAELVNTSATLQLTGMDYDQGGQFGPKFVATFIGPDGNAYQYSMQSRGGRSPRDKVNRWLWELINKQHKGPVPVQLVKRGSAFLLDRPGSESDKVPVEGVKVSADAADIPPF